MVFGEVVVDDMTVALIVDQVLGQRRPDPEDHAAVALGCRGLHVKDAPRRKHTQHPPHTGFARHGIYRNFREMRAEARVLHRLARVSRLDMTGRRQRFAQERAELFAYVAGSRHAVFQGQVGCPCTKHFCNIAAQGLTGEEHRRSDRACTP